MTDSVHPKHLGDRLGSGLWYTWRRSWCFLDLKQPQRTTILLFGKINLHVMIATHEFPKGIARQLPRATSGQENSLREEAEVPSPCIPGSCSNLGLHAPGKHRTPSTDLIQSPHGSDKDSVNGSLVTGAAVFWEYHKFSCWSCMFSCICKLMPSSATLMA